MANDDLKRSGHKIAPATFVAVAAACLGGCPIARPPVPPAYYEFREILQEAVADTVAGSLRGDPEGQERLEGRLTELAAIVRTDSLLLALDGDPVLWPLASSIGFVLNRTLRSDRVDGSVRDAFRRPAGQRQAVDAIVIGLGLGLRRLRVESGAVRPDLGTAERALPLELLGELL